MKSECLAQEVEKNSSETTPKLSKRVRGVFEKVPGSGEWWIRYTDADGCYRREVAGTKGMAIDLYRKRKVEALEGKKLPERLRRAQVQFREIADDAIAYIKAGYARPADDVARVNVIKEWFPGKGAENITTGEIKAALQRAAVEKKWSISTRNHHHNLLSLIYRLAVEAEKVKRNPMTGIHKAPESNSRVRFLTADEEKKIRDAIRSKPEWAEHEPEFDFALHTGLRRTDMYVRLVWENVDLEARVAKIPRSKNGDPVVVALNDDAIRALLVLRARGTGQGRVVRNSSGETLSVNAHWFRPAVRCAGVKAFRWHDLRHTFASRLRQAGTSLANIAELLGHRQLVMSRRYAHLSVSDLHKEVARIATPTDTTIAPQPSREMRESQYVN